MTSNEINNGQRKATKQLSLTYDELLIAGTEDTETYSNDLNKINNT